MFVRQQRDGGNWKTPNSFTQKEQTLCDIHLSTGVFMSLRAQQTTSQPVKERRKPRGLAGLTFLWGKDHTGRRETERKNERAKEKMRMGRQDPYLVSNETYNSPLCRSNAKQLQSAKGWLLHNLYFLIKLWKYFKEILCNNYKQWYLDTSFITKM